MINRKDVKRKQKLDIWRPIILKYLYVNTPKGMVKNAMPFNMSEHFFDMSVDP